MNTKLHAICDRQGRPLTLFVTAGQVGDDTGVRALLSSLPKVEWLVGDRGYDAGRFRDALQDKGVLNRLPGRKQPQTAERYDKREFRVEIMFGKLKGWRGVAPRKDRSLKAFLSAAALAATACSGDETRTGSEPGSRGSWWIN